MGSMGILFGKLEFTVRPDQAYPPQDSINAFIIRKLNPLVVVAFRFISTFLHAE